MSPLFQPMDIQGLTLKNRLFALPVFTGYALPDGRVSPLMLEHYKRLAKSGASVVVVPNVAVTKNGRTSERSLVLDHDEQIHGVKRLAAAIKANNAVACIQLNHGGRYAVSDRPILPSAMTSLEIAKNITTLKSFMETFPFRKRFGLTAHLAKMCSGWTRQMENEDIEKTILHFGEAASRAVHAGFDMVELHGATGYLIAQFLSARTNKRGEPWGGSLENRMRFTLRIVDEIKRRLPERIPVGFRLILDAKIENGINFEEANALAKALEQRGIGYLSATVGTYQSMFLPEVAKTLARPGNLTELTKRLKSHVSVPVVISGRIVSPKLAEKILQKKEADIIGLGRPLLADPDWIKKAASQWKIEGNLSSEKGKGDKKMERASSPPFTASPSSMGIRGKGVTRNGQSEQSIIGCKNCNACFRYVALGESLICERWPKAVQDRIRLETRFTSRHGYRSLIVISSVADIDLARFHVRQRAPIHQGLDRQLFLNRGKEEGFSDAARQYRVWSEHYFQTELQRGKIENQFVDEGDFPVHLMDPMDVVMAQLKENFGFVCIFHDDRSEWKKELIRKLPADVVAIRGGGHPNIKKVLIPCDLSTVTLMQIRVALHLFHGRADVDFRFVHVSESPVEAVGTWSKMVENFENPSFIPLTILPARNDISIAEILLEKAKNEEYGSLIIGRRGGLAHVRRALFGSVSRTLLDKLPACTFAIVG